MADYPLKKNEDMPNGNSTISTNDLYKALQFAETGHLEGDEKWIRTQAKGTKSSAFGPVQITKSALSGIGYDDVGFSKEQDEWIQNEYIPQADKMLQYGGDDMVEGMEKFDYGGPGDFKVEDRKMYESVAKKLIEFEWDRSGHDINKFIKAWRGVDESKDERYYKKVKDTLELLGPSIEGSSLKKIKAENKAFNAMLSSTREFSLS